MVKGKISTRIKIAGATLTTIFTLFSAFTATYAWFSTNMAFSAAADSFTVQAKDGVEFSLYYLHHFAVSPTINKNGNYNFDTDLFSGYELTYSNPVFVKVNYDSEGHVSDVDDPTNISHLWPAHRITYAIVVTSGQLEGFNLESWDEIRSPSVLTRINDEDVEISLSWAINMYGGAYYVTSTETITDDISTGFTSYAASTLTDKFPYSESNIAPETEKPSLNIVDSISGESGNNKRVILYFTIEFSDDSSTYYTYQNPYYVKDVFGDSNCYENLSFTDLVFKLY